MKKNRGWLSLFALFVACWIALTGCALLEEDNEPAEETSATASTGKQAETKTGTDEASSKTEQPAKTKETQSKKPPAAPACHSNEQEVEPGVCSYIVDCQTAKACEAVAAKLIRTLEKEYGELTFTEEWEFDEKMIRQSKREAKVIAGYPVKSSKLSLKPSDEDEEYYKWLWDRFAWIIPSAEREMISRFEVFKHVELMAYVIQDDEEYEKWTYAVNEEQATYESERLLTDIHEFGHLLALNAGQIDPYASEKSCGTHYWDEGCANNNAYMYKFYQKFWKDGEDDDADHFVSEYAMNDVYEDFAESWSHFVVTPRPKGNSIVEQKVAFFYNFDNLVVLKANILGRMGSWLDRNAVE